MQLNLWLSADVQPPDDTWEWMETQQEAESMLGLNWNRADTNIVVSVGHDGLVLLKQLEVFARFGAITKPIKLESHVVSDELDAAIKKVEAHWNV